MRAAAPRVILPSVRVSSSGPVCAVCESWSDCVDGAGREWDECGLVALAEDGQGVVPAVLGQVHHLGGADLANPQPVEGQQARQRVGEAGDL